MLMPQDAFSHYLLTVSVSRNASGGERGPLLCAELQLRPDTSALDPVTSKLSPSTLALHCSNTSSPCVIDDSCTTDAQRLVKVAAPGQNQKDCLLIKIARAKPPSEDDHFFVETNVPNSRGTGWRTLVNFLRGLYVAQSTGLPRPSESEDVFRNPWFIRSWLSRGTHSHSVSLSSVALLPSFCQQSPSFASVSPSSAHLIPADQRPPATTVVVDAPADYSQFDVVDLTLTLGQEFFTQFTRDSNPSDLDTACFLQWLAVNASSAEASSVAHLTSVVEFTETLTERYRLLHSPDDLFDGLNLLRSTMIVAALDPADLTRDKLVNNFASLLVAGMCPVYTPDDRFESAVTWFRETMSAQPSRFPLVVTNLGILYRECSEKMGRPGYLDTSVEFFQQSLALISTSDADVPQRIHVLRNLMNTVYSRHRGTRDYSDLELSLQYYQEALALEARGIEGSTPRWMLLTDASRIIQDADLDGAIAALREGIELCPRDHPQRYGVLAHLADTLFKRYSDRSASSHANNRDDWTEACLRDLEEAATWAKSALELAPDNHATARAYFLIRVATILSEQTLQAEKPSRDDLDEVVRMSQEALARFESHPKRHIALQLLGLGHLRRFNQTKDYDDLTAAHLHLSSALDMANAGIGVFHRAAFLTTLAGIHLIPDTAFFDMRKACTLLSLCLEDQNVDAVTRLNFMQSALRPVYGELISSSSAHYSDLADVYLRAVDLLPEVAYLGLDVKASLEALRAWENLAVQTSFVCARAKRDRDAVQTIEKGRATFWSQMLKVRSRTMEDVPLELGQRLQDLARQIEDTRYLAHRSSIDAPAVDWVRRRRLGEKYEMLLREIRSLPGQEEFATLSPEQLMSVGAKGPVVILAAHEQTCIAYILVKTHSDSTPKLLVQTLEDVDLTVLRRYVSQLENAAVNRGDRDGVQRDSKTVDDEETWTSSMIDEAARDQNDADRAVRFQKTSGGHDVLRPLWYKVVKPIFAALGLQPTSGRRRPRIWWCPTGLFTFLPIHAAGDHNRFGESCFDYVVSSYTPTCAALLHARKTFNPVRMTEAKVLLGAVPRPFEGPPLKGTVAELEQISGIIPSQQCISLPESDNPILHSHGGLTSQTVLSKLPEASILHLASHGVQDHKNPLESGFILRDAKLTIAQLMPLPLPRAFLAYLSACETAKGDQAQADQAIHLAATMLFAGFKSVVGTMWKMSDCDGPRVASHLYGQLFASQEYLDPDVVPYALDEAVQAMRTEGVSSSRWATFIHLGM